MITARAFAGKHYAVYGLARSGLATVEALLASGAKVTAWDANEDARANLSPLQGGGQGEALTGGPAQAPSLPQSATLTAPPAGERLEIADLDTIDLAQFDSIVVTPGLPLNRHPIASRARDAGVEIIGDIELFARARPELPPHKVVGITGTNGKSTTTALVHHILQIAGVPTTMGGNIGLPILAQDPLPEGGVYVLELSSYQIDLTQSLDCDVAVLLNITPDHLDRYDSFDSYAASKARLFTQMQTLLHPAVLIADGGAVSKIVRALNGYSEALFEVTSAQLSELQDQIGKQTDWPALPGPHNAQNAVAAVTAARALRSGLLGTPLVEWKAIREALRTYPGLPHRMDLVREREGVIFVNDSKATNPTATAPALAAFPAIRWILGGQAKTDNLDECAPHFAHVRSAYTIGEAAELFETLLAPHMPVKNCGELGAAVREAAADAEAGDTVLLSPACASFDQFKDFEARGDAFRELVGAL
ncbi:UDP-N-acetylmuramoyl-L-alanine--D-glutamate ligase [Sphingomonas sp.]|uniref:UDP-N-acetylmuramoyl-L-alanine--D-glutamate ligase n=1 Tax=Sphingomonas sp. TaxID=28214 RepID=UPI00286E653A|nr:UDP-N-acetylmuramoyl-L-alanine--D-glutamate ligase [Sphingomonas sp.]